MPLEPASDQRVQAGAGRVLTFIALVLSLVAILGTAQGWRVAPLLFGLSLIFSVFALGCVGATWLPVQNVVGACLVAALFGGGAHAATHEIGIPFGQIVYSQDNQRLLFGLLIWPLTWVFALLACRGVSRLLLRPLRGSRAYGLWQLSTTGALMLLTGFSIEQFGTGALGYWTWADTKWPVSLAGVPLVALAGWLLVSLLILAFATPILINKKPGPTPAPGIAPVLLWAGVQAWMIAAMLKQGLSPAGFTIACSVPAIVLLALAFGLRGHHSKVSTQGDQPAA